MCFPEGVFLEDVVPGRFRSLFQGVVVAVVRRVIFMFNKVEVTTYNQVNVVGYVAQELELFGASVVVIVTCSQVDIQKPK